MPIDNRDEPIRQARLQRFHDEEGAMFDARVLAFSRLVESRFHNFRKLSLDTIDGRKRPRIAKQLVKAGLAAEEGDDLVVTEKALHLVPADKPATHTMIHDKSCLRAYKEPRGNRDKFRPFVKWDDLNSGERRYVYEHPDLFTWFGGDGFAQQVELTNPSDKITVRYGGTPREVWPREHFVGWQELRDVVAKTNRESRIRVVSEASIKHAFKTILNLGDEHASFLTHEPGVILRGEGRPGFGVKPDEWNASVFQMIIDSAAKLEVEANKRKAAVLAAQTALINLVREKDPQEGRTPIEAYNDGLKVLAKLYRKDIEEHVDKEEAEQNDA